MSTRNDPLATRADGPDRVVYATGVLLDAQDFQAEQNYHRGRLARALSYASGAGTVAGLGVVWEKTDAEDRFVDRVRVEPGMAIDRLGRIVELTAPVCIRLQPWYDAQKPSALALSYRHLVRITPDVSTRTGDQWAIEAGTTEMEMDGVVVDVFIRFAVRERGKTPSFAAGPFDATDAVQPSRLRDGCEVTLHARVASDPDLPLPVPDWPALEGVSEPSQRQRRLQDAILARWRERSPYWTKDGLIGGPEHLPGQDPTALFLARMVLPATTSHADTARPVRNDPHLASEPVRVDNHGRAFVYTASALARVFSWHAPEAADQPVNENVVIPVEPEPAPSPQPPGT